MSSSPAATRAVLEAAYAVDSLAGYAGVDGSDARAFERALDDAADAASPFIAEARTWRAGGDALERVLTALGDADGPDALERVAAYVGELVREHGGASCVGVDDGGDTVFAAFERIAGAGHAPLVRTMLALDSLDIGGHLSRQLERERYNWVACESARRNRAHVVRALIADGHTDFSASLSTVASTRAWFDKAFKASPSTAFTNFELTNPLCAAAIAGASDVVRILLVDEKVLNDQYVHFWTSLAFMLAFVRGHVECARELISHYNGGMRSLVRTLATRVSTNRCALAELLMDITTPRERAARELLLAAATANAPDLARVALDAGANPMENDAHALFEAARSQSHAVVRLMLDDVRFDASIANRASLVRASISAAGSDDASSDAALALIADGRIDPTLGPLEQKPIIIAALCNNTRVVRALLADARVDPRVSDSGALRVAASYGHVDVVRALLADGRVDVHACGGEALRVATRCRHTDVVAALRAHQRKQ